MFCGQMEGAAHLCIGTWADGWNVTPVYWYVDRWKERYTCLLVCGQMEGTVHLLFFFFFWLDLATMGMRLLSACAVKGTVGVPCSLQRNLLSVVVGSSRHDSASEACPSLDGGVSDN